MTTDPNKPRLGEALLEEGLLTKEQLEKALAEQGATSRMLGEFLLEQGIITETELVRAVANQLGVPGCLLRHGLIDPELLPVIGADEAERLGAIPMFKVQNTMTVAMAEPQSLPKIDRLRQLTGCRIRPVFAPKAGILEFIRTL